MAVIIQTQDPNKLREHFIRNIYVGKIRTWSVDQEGDITHTNPKWAYKAWFEPKIDIANNQLQFGIIASQIFPMTNELYAVYHGRLATTLLANFDFLIEELSITPQLREDIDIIPH